MKKVLLFFVVFLIFSCAEEKKDFFELTPSSFSINKPQQTVVVKIESNSSWIALEIPSWIKPKQTSGSGSYDLELLVSENNDDNGQTRVGTLKFLSNNKFYVLTIEQTAAATENPVKILNNTNLNLDYTQQVYNIQVSSTKPWYIDSKPDWVQLNPTSGNAGIRNVQVTIQANNSIQLRSGETFLATETPRIYNIPNWTVLNISQTFNTIPVPDPIPVVIHWELIKGNIENTSDRVTDISSAFKNGVYYLMHKTSTALYPNSATGHIDILNGNNWSNVGDIYNCVEPKIAIDPNNIPYAVYNRNQFYKFTPGLNAVTTLNNQISVNDFTIANNGLIYAVYTDFSNNNRVSVKSFNGLSWQQVGKPSISLGRAWYGNSKIELNQNGKPFIAYFENDSRKLFVKSFDGTNWNVVGGLEISADGDDFDLKIGSDNSIFLVYTQNYEVIVKKYVSGNWIDIGSPLILSANGKVNLALNSQNIPYVTIGTKIYKFNNGLWTLLEDFLINANNQYLNINPTFLRSSSLTFDQNDRPIFAFSMDGNLSLKVLRYIN